MNIQIHSSRLNSVYGLLCFLPVANFDEKSLHITQSDQFIRGVTVISVDFYHPYRLQFLPKN